MAFQRELIEGLLREVAAAQILLKMGRGDQSDVGHSRIFYYLTAHLTRAVDIRMRAEQAQVFMDIPEIP
jgi:hypothetical protein